MRTIEEVRRDIEDCEYEMECELKKIEECREEMEWQETKMNWAIADFEAAKDDLWRLKNELKMLEDNDEQD